MKEIDLFLNEDYLKYGIQQYVTWNPDKAPHIAIFGATGSGKTYCAKLILARISKMLKNAQFYICDYKGDTDFSFMDGTKDRFYRFTDCERGLNDYYERFKKRQSGEDLSRNMILLVFDEWGAYVTNQPDKRKSDSEKSKLGTILLMGRSFNANICLCNQRLDSAFFSASTREQYSVVVSLSNISQEARDMIYRDYKDEIKSDRKQGTGYMITNGTDLTRIVVPKITDMNLVNAYIKDAVTR